MATQLLVDFGSIGEQIANGVKTSLDKVTEQITSSIKPKDAPHQKPAFSIREQILANASTLYPMIDRKSPRYNTPYGETSTTPAPKIIVTGGGTTIRARVVYGLQEVTRYKKYVFVDSHDADSAEGALQKLLEVTMQMLQKEMGESIFREDSKTWVDIGLGGYFKSA